MGADHQRRIIGYFTSWRTGKNGQPAYLATIQRGGYRLPDGYLELGERLTDIRRALAVLDEGTVPCNNDLLAGNFIEDGANDIIKSTKRGTFIFWNNLRKGAATRPSAPR